jgi:hypothetical protein
MRAENEAASWGCWPVFSRNSIRKPSYSMSISDIDDCEARNSAARGGRVAPGIRLGVEVMALACVDGSLCRASMRDSDQFQFQFGNA